MAEVAWLGYIFLPVRCAPCSVRGGGFGTVRGGYGGSGSRGCAKNILSVIWSKNIIRGW